MEDLVAWPRRVVDSIIGWDGRTAVRVEDLVTLSRRVANYIL